MKDTRNCKERCHYARFCYRKGWDDLDPDDCAEYWKIDDLLLEARYDREDETEEEEEEE